MTFEPEEIIDPERPIIDAHHHLWVRPGSRYLLDEFLADTATGHNIVGSVFVQCGAMYRPDGPVPERPLGETEFANGIAAMALAGQFGPTRVNCGIVGYADLMLGAAVEEVLAEHKRLSDRFRGVRYMLAWDEDESVLLPGYEIAAKRALERQFQEGVRALGRQGLSYDTLLFHPQYDDLAALADACPDVTIVLNHVGLPLNIGRKAGSREAVTREWREALAELAKRPNIVVKLGGLGTRWLGFDFERSRQQPSAVLAQAWQPYIETCIGLFGADRCMLESNFPVDGVATDYRTLWNALKRIVADASDSEKHALFGGTAARVYRLNVPGYGAD